MRKRPYEAICDVQLLKEIITEICDLSTGKHMKSQIQWRNVLKKSYIRQVYRERRKVKVRLKLGFFLDVKVLKICSLVNSKFRVRPKLGVLP